MQYIYQRIISQKWDLSSYEEILFWSDKHILEATFLVMLGY
jgi:hypothetical protein